MVCLRLTSAVTPRRLLADNLARAALSAPAEPHAVGLRCEQVLGGEAPWLGNLVRVLLAHHGDAWHAHGVDAVRDTILQHRGFSNALAGGRAPRLRRLAIEPEGMAPARIAGGDLVVPSLGTPGDIAQWLGLESRELIWFSAIHRGLRADPPPKAAHYRYRWVRKRSGGWRLLEMPRFRLREMQRKILHGILESVPIHDCAHGFRAGRSALTNARLHLGRRVVIRLDLRDFFLGIRVCRIQGLFKAMGYPIAAANVLAGLCTARVPESVMRSDGAVSGDDAQVELSWSERQPFLENHLPQGAPTSPALANLCAFHLDRRLAGLARAMGACYTRYADDLVFSGDEALRRAVDRLLPWVGAICLEEGFVLNHRKTRVMLRAGRQTVTGVVVNSHTNLARDHYDRLKAMLHNARGSVPAEDWLARMRGHLAHASSLNPSRGERLQQLYLEVVGGA